MKNAVGCFFLISVAVFAQNPSDKAAAGARKPVEIAQATAPKICSIPLLNFKPSGTFDTQMTHKPPAAAVPSRGDTVQVPAPACNQALFTNK
jgi:hypothetical protein